MNENYICIKIDFERNSENPQRVFESMAHLISSIENFHACLLSSVSAEAHSRFLLSDVKEGSIESWLCPALDGDVQDSTKQRIAMFLNSCTNKVISFIENKGTLNSLDELNELEGEIAAEVALLDIEVFPNVFSLDKYRLLKGYSELGKATDGLNDVDEAYLKTSSGVRKINKNFHLSEDDLQSILIERVEEQDTKEVLVIKKADFIGRSMWDFIRSNVTISVKLRDEHWLNKFHQRIEVVSPGDGLLCDLVTYVYYDKSSNVIDVKYEIVKVHKRVEQLHNQLGLDHE